MRIIDADELKKCKVYSEERHEYVVAVFNIDNAPTVELTETEIQAVLNKRCMTAVTNEYLIALHNNRPTGETTGEWIEDSGIVACSHCRCIWLYRKTKYCPNCGARMEGQG